MKLIEQHIESLQELCKRHYVEKMYLFGSALNQNFNASSDIDFLVKFQKIDLAQYFNNYMDLKDDLKKLLGREIDLVEEQSLRNPILINSINQHKQLIYG